MMMMPDFTFEVKPVVVRKEHTKSNDLADPHLAHGIEVTTAFGKIGDAGGMSFLAAMPHRIQINAESGFRASVIHEPRAIIIFFIRGLNIYSYSQCFGNDLERGRQSSRKFSIDFQSDFIRAIRCSYVDFACERVADFRHREM